jgi:hypothetical protein
MQLTNRCTSKSAYKCTDSAGCRILEEPLFNIDTSWMRVVNFSFHRLYPQGNRHLYLLHRRLGWLQSRLGLMEKGKICRIWGFHGEDYEECRLLAYKTPVRTSEETHYVSTTEPKQVWGSHGGDYEECCLLGYKIPVRTSQETCYVSSTEHSQLMLCQIWGFHSGDYEECCPSGCYTAYLL